MSPSLLSRPMLLLLIALCIGPAHAYAAADDCDRPMGTRMVNRDTRDAGDMAEKLVRQAGIDADLRAIRLRVLKNDHPRADVDVTTRRMLRAYCQVIWADGSLRDDGKAARVHAAEQEMTRAVEGPAEVARTNSRIRAGDRRDEVRVLLAAAAGDVPIAQWHFAAISAADAPALVDDYLRDTPSFVNESNKYFVIVASASSADSAVRKMRQLKAKAPKYDFVVYQPYGSNSAYGVMMATWVARDVALKVLREARASVAPDAFLWACRSTGESC